MVELAFGIGGFSWAEELKNVEDVKLIINWIVRVIQFHRIIDLVLINSMAGFFSVIISSS